MSDHVDGPRSIGEPAADVTDLFAFTSPENPARTVLAMCVFPSAGEDAIFSNAIDHSIVVRRVTVAGIGNAAKFQPADDEIRFSFRFEVAEARCHGKAIQRGVCTLPDGRQLSLTVNDETGRRRRRAMSACSPGCVPILSTSPGSSSELKKLPNLLQHDNVLCMVVEFDTTPRARSREGLVVRRHRRDRSHPAAARASSDLRPAASTGSDVPSRPTCGSTIRRCRGSTTCATCGISRRRSRFRRSLQPLFLKRLKDSFATWDMLDGTADWTPEALAANANVFLDDFLLFDVAKPITDKSHLEIEKSTLDGRPYQTGGGRTVDANSIDILLTWLVNRDREFLQGGATGATKPGMKVFPYFATPNTELQTIAESVELAAAPDEVWSLIGQFDLRLASPGRESQPDRHGNRPAAHDRNARRQGNRRTSRGDRQREAVLSLHEHRRDSGFPLHRHARSDAEGQRQRRRLARAISGQQSTRHCREGLVSPLHQDGISKV